MKDRAAVDAIADSYRKARDVVRNEPKVEACDGYFKRWNKSRAAKYPKQAKADEAAWRLWLKDDLGSVPFKSVTRERLIETVHRLDTIAADGGHFTEKRARNIFSVLSAMFRDAYSSKDRSLRVLEANPCTDVPWPERPTTKALKQLLYPAEFLALVSALTCRSSARGSMP
jgi:hypothetical protein